MVAALPLHFTPSPSRRLARSVAAEAELFDRDDRRIVVHGVAWEQYVALNDALGDQSGVRVCYCEGTLELMSPGLLHEEKKKTIARLVELHALARDVPLQGAGSTTYREKPKARGAEPDECYFLGKLREGPADLVIEVAVSRSALDKLALYAGLGVKELWIWRQADDGGDAHVTVFHLGKSGYREARRSKILPDLDVEELATFVRMDDQAAAAKAYWKRLQGKRPARR